MMIYIGNNISIFIEDIVAILDARSVLDSKENKSFINKLIDKGCLVNKLDKEVKTYIICLDRKKNNINGKRRFKLYMSNILSTSLLKRINIKEQDWRKVNGQCS